MKNINKISIFTLTILAFLTSVTESQASVSCSTTDCEALGYTMNASSCSGVAMVKCPFDETKVVCRPKVNTPIFNIVKQAIGTYCTYPDSLHTPMSDCFYDYGYDLARKIKEIFKGKGVDIEFDSDYDFYDFNTPQDAITYVENQLIKDPCEGYVEFDPNLEKCTSYCSSDSSKCMVAELITCDEAISAAGGKKLSSSTTSTTSISNIKYYLTTDVTFTGSISNPSGYSFYSAARLPPCRRELDILPEDTKLTINRLNFTGATNGYGYFYVPTTLNYVDVASQTSITLGFSYSSTVKIFKDVTSTYNTEVRLHFYDDEYESSLPESDVFVYYTGDYDSSYSLYSTMEIYAEHHNVGYCYTESDVDVIIYTEPYDSSTIEEDWWICESSGYY